MEGAALPNGLLAEAKRLADQYQFFHWHLAFPEVFAQGGFDVSLGNPPWERVKLQEKEWFAERRPDITNARNAAARKRLIEELKATEPALYQSFLGDSRKAEGESHLLRISGLYPLCGRGDINLYTVFTEGMRNLLSPVGRAGCVIPSGIATDDTTKFFFQSLVTCQSLVSLYDFENVKNIFAGVGHGRFKFCLLTLSGRKKPVTAADFVFFAHSVEDLAKAQKHFTLTANDVALINPNSFTCAIFGSQRDAELGKSIYRRVPVFVRDGSPATNPWGVTFMAMFHMANDSELFQTQPLPNHMPLYEAKMVQHFDHRFGDYADYPEGALTTILPDVPKARLQNSNYAITPRYWVHNQEVRDRLHSRWEHNWLVGWRDVTHATNDRTLIAGVIPAAAVNHKFLLMFSTQPPSLVACLLANLSSFMLDHCARQKVGGLSLNYFILKQFPVLAPETYNRPCLWSRGTRTFKDWLLSRVLELTYTAWDLESFAQDCGWSGPPFRWDEERRFLLRCELDAAFFHLYLGSEEEWRKQPTALTQAFPTPRDAVSYIMDTFPIVKRKDEARTEQKNAAGEGVKRGYYRTKRTILEIYDALAESIRTSAPYQTRLDPPPADVRCCHPPKLVIPPPTWLDQPLVLPTSHRVAIAPDRYRAAVVPHLLYQSGGSVSFERFRKAYWLLTEPKTLERYATGTVGDIARKWGSSFKDKLEKDMFIPHLKKAVGRQLHFVRRGDERWLELRDPKVADDEHVIFDARLALLVADLWPAAEPIAPLSPPDEVAVQELEAVL